MPSLNSRLKPFLNKHCTLSLSDSKLSFLRSLQVKTRGKTLALYIFDWDKCDANTQGIICEEAGQDDFPAIAVVNASRDADELEEMLDQDNGYLLYSDDTVYIGSGDMETLMPADEFFENLKVRSDDEEEDGEEEEESDEESDDDDSDEDSDDDSDAESGSESEDGEPAWLRITKETDWANISKDERWEKLKTMAQGMSWRSYDWKSSPAADMNFPDFTDEELAVKAPWLPKHYNKVGSMETCHVPDLNQIKSGEERKMMALYGIPVEWPKLSKEPDRLNEFLDLLDAARAKGGDDFAQALDDHGLLNEEHYLWLRHERLGFPKSMVENPKVDEIVQSIDAAIASGNGRALFDQYGFRDQLHYDWFKGYFAKVKAKAMAKNDEALAKVNAQLAQQMETNKAALSGELAPFLGVSLEDWARSNAKIIQGTPVDAVVAGLKIDKATWDQVNTEWNARMARDRTFTVATVYGKAFTGGL